ncbi:MAG: ABC transporter substrate-binding protein [Bacteroidota bacterium]|jgi:ABC-type Fe3+-hydroxamate transport system substrate-binding protein|nr:ABC transporter substrate-binding protein [Bacteroidota bacterium]
MQTSTYKDMMGRWVAISHSPKRIISLVPSQTELLFDLGLDEEVVGITKFCEHPNAWRKQKTIVGGTKKVDYNIIDQLAPDLIIANKEENTKEMIAALEAKYPVWISDVTTKIENELMIEQIGALVQRPQQALLIISKIQQAFSKLKCLSSDLKVAYFIWKDPWMVAASNTFIQEMLLENEWSNVFEHKERYPIISIDELIEANPEVIFLSSEPYPFKDKHIEELALQLPNTKIILVDGTYFSWYGSRMQNATAYFEELHQQLYYG